MSEALDSEDARLLLQGDPARLSDVCAVIAAVVRRFGFRDPAVREDLAQDALARVFLNLRAGRYRSEASLTTYAQNIAKYACLEHLRRRRREAPIDPDATASGARWSGPEEAFMRAEEHQHNLKVLASMSKECRDLFRLIFIEELTYKEVAVRLGISEGAVKSRVRRCRLTGDRSSEGDA